MMSKSAETLTERRRHTRRTVGNGIFAVLCRGTILFREIMDISPAGVRLCCHVDDELPKGSFSLSFVTGEGMFVDTVLANAVWTSPFQKIAKPSRDSKKQWGLKLEEPPSEQVFQLQSFVESQPNP
jgi:hypothetical protein